MKKHVAVIGAGIFGATAAIRLARLGIKVDLFDAHSDLLMGASGINQYRLHRGYHYPRSVETAISCRDSHVSFRSEYDEAVLDYFEHYYAISNTDSLVTAAEFTRFLDDMELAYQPVEVSFIRPEAIDACFRVVESIFDIRRLRQIVRQKLSRADVTVHFNREVTLDDVKDYHSVVIATYASLNSFAKEASALRYYHYEVCEKPVVRLPPSLRGKSIVILDGPFMCIDPLGEQDLAVMGNVTHAIHHRNVGIAPEIPEHLLDYIDRGIVTSPVTTNFQKFIESAAKFFPNAHAIEHVGSMFTVRAVLPENDETDARPTLVQSISPKIISIFSGKIVTCVIAADKVADIVMTKG